MKVKVTEISRDGTILITGHPGYTDQTHFKFEGEEGELVSTPTDPDKSVHGWYVLIAPSEGRLELEAVEEVIEE